MFVVSLIMFLGADPAFSSAGRKSEAIMLKKLTPLLVVDRIEPSLDFWVERLGWQKVMGVPEDAPLAFAMLQHGDLEIMYQTTASISADTPAVGALLKNQVACLYVEVASLDNVIARLDGVEVVMPKRKMAYGSIEIGVREPGGHLVTFAEFPAIEQPSTGGSSD